MFNTSLVLNQESGFEFFHFTAMFYSELSFSSDSSKMTAPECVRLQNKSVSPVSSLVEYEYKKYILMR